MSRNNRRRHAPRHALDSELTPEVPDSRVRDAMAEFYKSSEGYARQQGTHSTAYFSRLLDVIDAVLTQPDLHVLEIGAGSAAAMHTFLATHPRARAVAMELSPASIRAATRVGSPTRRRCAPSPETPCNSPFGIDRSTRSSRSK